MRCKSAESRREKWGTPPRAVGASFGQARAVGLLVLSEALALRRTRYLLAMPTRRSSDARSSVRSATKTPFSSRRASSPGMPRFSST